MPRVSPELIASVFYLYRSGADARARTHPAGTGFIVSMRDPLWEGPLTFCYGVTNWHVACRGASVIGLSCADGTVEVLEFGPEEWHFLPSGPDVAVVPLNLDPHAREVQTIQHGMFTDRRRLARMAVGDDIFMLGLFVDEHDRTTNVPKARFGHVSMLADKRAPIRQPTGYEAESFVIDAHSRSGFSGSPVFLYTNPLVHLNNSFPTIRGTVDASRIASDIQDNFGRLRNVDVEIRLSGRPSVQLLGMHWGQFAERWDLEKRDVQDIEKESYVTTGTFVNGFSGMTCVLPSWQIMDVINMPELKEMRERKRQEANAGRGDPTQ